MPVDFRMPSLGPDMESGTLVEWRVKPGDVVKHGDVVALVETDKGIIDVEIFTDGTVERLLVGPGTHVPVGTPLAHLTGEAPAAAVEEVPAPAVATAAVIAGPRPPEAPPPAAGRLKISPAARAKARALGIDPAMIAGTGAGGAVTLEDVATHAVPAAPAVRPTGMRDIIAKAMARSKREIPHYYLTLQCPLLNARNWLDRYNAAVSVEERMLPAALFVKAVGFAARRMPDFNGFYEAPGFIASSDVHVGVAIATRGGGLVAPAILNADAKSLSEIMRELRDLTNRVRAGHMRGSELAQPTITVTSVGDEGIEMVLPVIYPPQVAMVGFGSILERPWIVDGSVRPVPVVDISLAADHRVTDGRAGARFLAHVRDALQDPERL